MSAPIDFVIAWVDGSDPAWLAEKNKYSSCEKFNIESSGVHRYRDWDNLRYWFRAVEKFAPWVRKVHFVTCGHAPRWLNMSHPKLNYVKHADYIPGQYLPTFNSHTIELNFHRIKDLSEQFVYFNDDMFIIKPIKESDFFVNDLPCGENVFIPTISFEDHLFAHIRLNTLLIINKHFNKKEIVKKQFFKLFTLKYGVSQLLKTIYCLPLKSFSGFYYSHTASSFLKSTFEEVWKTEPEILHQTSARKFRNELDVNQYLIQQWQLMTGNFYPKGISKTAGSFHVALDHDIQSAIIKQKYKTICINDALDCPNFEELKSVIIAAFKKILPEKSSYEI